MAGVSQTAFASGRLGKAGGFAIKLAPLWRVFGRAFETEVALRRPFLWLPVAAGAVVQKTGIAIVIARALRILLIWVLTYHSPAWISETSLRYAARSSAAFASN